MTVLLKKCTEQGAESNTGKKRRYGVYPTENEEKEGREYKWEIERD